MEEKSLILDAQAIEKKINRMVHEVHEKCFLEKELIICGIEGDGNALAKKIADGLKKVSPINVQLVSIVINKDNPLKEPIICSVNKDYTNAAVILIDDVCNSGKTIIYGCNYFMQYKVKWIKTLVLVDRNHNRFPVYTDFVGLRMSTTLKEHIEVNLTKGKEAVYLM